MSIWRRKTAAEQIGDVLPEVFPRLWRYSLSLTGNRDAADDLAQAACLRAMENATRFAPGSGIDAWMFRITHNLWISTLRKTAVRTGGGLVAVDETVVEDPAPGPERQALNREVLRTVLRLPEAQRVTVILVYAEGYSYREAADILDVPVGTVMSRLATARAALGQKFRDQETQDAR
ncbi:RNA polymerase sigma factor [uncultured Roseobacter sp.]|uniref:RNA polymerase sigma factor n=1 Tax=uncultured Roseobacter sp. TaxID=114847 RepID=UPI00260220F7|nr:RNA polymerase sigma factor [uncultured Roseobacter sp.]